MTFYIAEIFKKGSNFFWDAGSWIVSCDDIFVDFSGCLRAFLDGQERIHLKHNTFDGYRVHGPFSSVRECINTPGVPEEAKAVLRGGR